MSNVFSHIDVGCIYVTAHAQEQLQARYNVCFTREQWQCIGRALLENRALLLGKDGVQNQTTCWRYLVELNGKQYPLVFSHGTRTIVTVLLTTRLKCVAGVKAKRRYVRNARHTPHNVNVDD